MPDITPPTIGVPITALDIQYNVVRPRPVDDVFDLDVEVANVLAGSTGLLMLVLGFGTIGFAVGAATGRRAIGLGVAAGLAVLAFMFDAIGPTIDAAWMSAVSPFSWFLEDSPLLTGFDMQGLALLAVVPIVAAIGALLGFTRRDLMV